MIDSFNKFSKRILMHSLATIASNFVKLKNLCFERFVLSLKIVMMFFVLIFMSESVFAQNITQAPPTAAQVDSYVNQAMKQLKIPGAALALFSDGKLTHLKGFGEIDNTGATVTPQSPFQLGSISKSFCALLILQLADEGRISLDDPVSKYISNFQTSDKTESDKISVRHLLNHRSGLKTITGNLNQDTTYRGADSMSRVTSEFKNADMFAVAGKRFQYSNANYMLLAQLIETIEKQSYENVVEKRIFSKLGMKNSFVQIETHSTSKPAIGHTQWFGYTVEKHFIAGRLMMGPGGVTSSAEDLATYLIAIFENDKRIVPMSLNQALTKERKGGYEFGWEFDTVDEQLIIFHGGLNPGFLATVKYKPKTKQGVLILTNMSGSLEGNLIQGATDYALGLPAVDIAPSGVSLLRLWGTLGLFCVLLIACLRSIYRLIKYPSKSGSYSILMKSLKIVIPSLLLFGLSYFLTFVVPQLSGVNIVAVRMFYPDVGLLLVVSSVISFIWAVVIASSLFRKNAVKHH